jgi:hypothetical protein
MGVPQILWCGYDHQITATIPVIVTNPKKNNLVY